MQTKQPEDTTDSVANTVTDIKKKTKYFCQNHLCQPLAAVADLSWLDCGANHLCL